jgi:hypothetical protein
MLMPRDSKLPRKDKGARDKDKRARELVSYREWAHRCAKEFRNAMKLQDDVRKKFGKTLVVDGPDEKYETAMEKVHFAWSVAGQSLWLLCGGNPRNLPDRLHKIALAAEGKLHGKNKKMDDLLIAAHAKAVEKQIQQRHKRGEKGLAIEDLFPDVSKVDDALAIIAGKTRVTESKNVKNRKRSLRRRLKQLGYG